MAQIKLEQNQSSPANQGMPGRIKSGQLRLLSYLALLAGLVLFAVLIAWIAFQFSLPAPGSMKVGTVEDFRAGQEPRLFWQESTPFYMVNTGEELVALAAQSLRAGIRCLVYWKPETVQFVDPCWGTRMNIKGMYDGGGPPWQMTPLPVKIINSEVWVEVNFPDNDWFESTAIPKR